MRKKGIIVACVLLTGALGLFGAGCATGGGDAAQAAGGSTSAQASTYIPVKEWAAKYPLQADSAKGYTERNGVKHGHYGIALRVLGPVDREVFDSVPQSTNLAVDENGYYKISGFHYDENSGQWVIDDDKLGVQVSETRIRQSCFACKSSLFNQLYAEEGTAVIGATLDEEFVERMNGQVWDCGLCHSDIDSPEQFDNTSIMYTLQVGDKWDAVPAGERVCAPCHAKLGGFNVAGITEDEIKATDPWKYGLDLESLMARDAETGAGAVDEATGIKMNSYAGHYDIEFFQGSIHQSLGLACVNCHMPSTVDAETGEAYTYHNASGSPLENEAALEFCLTCHEENQGIKTTEDMVTMVRGVQAESEKNQAKVREGLDELYQLIADGVAEGNVDQATLDKARANYETAYTYITWVCGKSSVGVPWVYDGGKTVHDPDEAKRVTASAQALVDEAIALFA